MTYYKKDMFHVCGAPESANLDHGLCECDDYRLGCVVHNEGDENEWREPVFIHDGVNYAIEGEIAVVEVDDEGNEKIVDHSDCEEDLADWDCEEDDGSDEG